jgi:uncharacterized membrane protein
MSLFSTLKQNSQKALDGRRGKAALILLLLMCVGLVVGVLLTAATFGINGWMPYSNPTMEPEHPNMPLEEFVLVTGIHVIMALFGVFLMTPLYLGINGWYLSVVKGKPEPFSAVFSFFERSGRYFRAVWYCINMSVRTMLWAFAFFALPAAALYASIEFYNRSWTSDSRQFALLSFFGLMLACVLTLFATVLYIVYMNKYFLVAYLLVNDDNITVFAAIRMSVKHSRGHRFSLLWFALSFIGWAILTMVPGVVFYTKPYIKTSFAMYAYYLMEKSRADKELSLTQEFSPEAPEPQEQQTAKLEWQAPKAPMAPLEELLEPQPEPPTMEIPLEAPVEEPPEPGKWPYV